MNSHIRPPEHIDGEEPIEAWVYRGRSCFVYGSPAGFREQELADSGDSPALAELYENAYRGYTRTKLTGDGEHLDIDVYGGVTWGITDDQTIGFDTMHGFPDGIESLGEMKAEVESMVDQLLELESERL